MAGGRWEKGQSGNPAGRAKPDSKSLELRELARRNTRQALAAILEIMRDKKAPHNARLTAAGMVLERGHGKPIQPVSNPDLTPLDFARMSDDEIKAAIGRLDAFVADAQAQVTAQRYDA